MKVNRADLRGGRAIRNHRAIAIEGWIRRRTLASTSSGKILKRPIVRWRLRQLLGQALRTFENHCAPDKLLHLLAGCYPGPAGFAPTRRTKDCHFQTQALRFGCRMPDSIQPLRGSE